MYTVLPLVLATTLTAPGPAESPAPSPTPPPASKLVPFGDFRLRQEWDWNLTGDRADRSRQRVRARAGLHWEHGSEWRATAAVRTGNPDDPNSPYQTLGDGFDSLDISFDQAWVRYRPSALSGLGIHAGKFPHPFVVNPVYGELEWDADIRPEGAAALVDRKLGEDWKLVGSAGALVTLERAPGEDGHAWLAQAGLDGKLDDGITLTAALGYHDYGDLTPGGDTTLLADNAGNATVDDNGDGKPDRYLSEFRVWHPLAALRLASGPGITLAAELVHNAGAEIDEDTGWGAGVSVGSTRKRGDWQLWYQYQHVERDSLLSAVAQDDAHRATAYLGHLFGIRWQVADKVGLHGWMIPTRPLPDPLDDGWSWRARIDLTLTP